MKDLEPSKSFTEKFMEADNPRSYTLKVDDDGKVTINGVPPDSVTYVEDAFGHTWIKATLGHGPFNDMFIFHNWNSTLNQPHVRQSGGKFWERVTFNTGRWFLEHWWWITGKEWEA